MVKKYDETRRLFEEADIYIQYMQNGDTYTIVDPQGSLFGIGSKEARLPEFSGYADNARIPPTVSRSRYGWLCTACEPVTSRTKGRVVGMGRP